MAIAMVIQRGVLPTPGHLMSMIPNSFYYERREFNLKQICQWASNKKFTHLIVLGEKEKKVHSMVVSHLPLGPTAMFKVSSIQLSKDVHNHGQSISSKPEIILNSFSTRLGHRVGRFLGSLYKHDPNFKAREVVTFHNQRDFIFVRHHRYIFDSGKVRLLVCVLSRSKSHSLHLLCSPLLPPESKTTGARSSFHP